MFINSKIFIEEVLHSEDKSLVEDSFSLSIMPKWGTWGRDVLVILSFGIQPLSEIILVKSKKGLQMFCVIFY